REPVSDVTPQERMCPCSMEAQEAEETPSQGGAPGHRLCLRTSRGLQCTVGPSTDCRCAASELVRKPTSPLVPHGSTTSSRARAPEQCIDIKPQHWNLEWGFLL